jgi:hypothetical protein
MTKHNKKRNVGVIHEQLVRYVGSAIISGDEHAAEKAVSIITKHFKPGTELHREFRLFNALVNVPAGNQEVSKLIVNEAKNAAKLHNKAKLSSEKSCLIKDINHSLSESRFYDIRIPNYRLYATVQSLLDSWRGARMLEIDESARYEHSLVEWLSRQNVKEPESKAVEHDPLVFKIMLKKFQEKYSSNLLPNQKKIVEMSLVKDKISMERELEKARKESLDSLIEFKKTCKNNFLLEKIDRVIKNIENFRSSDEKTNLSRTLQLLELVSEMKEDSDV